MKESCHENTHAVIKHQQKTVTHSTDTGHRTRTQIVGSWAELGPSWSGSSQPSSKSISATLVISWMRGVEVEGGE
jgi:hypothetical protein